MMTRYNDGLPVDVVEKIKSILDSGKTIPVKVYKVDGSSIRGGVPGAIGEHEGHNFFLWTDRSALNGARGNKTPEGFAYSYAISFKSGDDLSIEIDLGDEMPKSEAVTPKFLLLVNGGKEMGLADSKEQIGEYLITRKSEEDVRIFEIGNEVKPEVKVTFE